MKTERKTKPKLLRNGFHNLRIISQGIEIIKSDISIAESNRLKALRIYDSSSSILQHLKSDLENLTRKFNEDILITEFLEEDIQSLKSEIQANENHILANQCRIEKMEIKSNHKHIELQETLQNEIKIKEALEEAFLKKSNNGSGDNNVEGGGDGDTIKKDLSYLSSSYEELTQEREILEQEEGFMNLKLIELKSKYEILNSELKNLKYDFELKERQYKDGVTKNKNTNEELQNLEIQIISTEYKLNENETSCKEAHNHLRNLKKLLEIKQKEKIQLEKSLKRDTEIQDLKKFSKYLKLPVYYSGIEKKKIKYLTNLVKGSTANHSPFFWTDDIDDLCVNFNEKIPEFQEISPPRMMKRRSKFISISNQSKSKNLEIVENYEQPIMMKITTPKINKPKSKFNFLGKRNKIWPIGGISRKQQNHQKNFKKRVGWILRKRLMQLGNFLADGIDKYPKVIVVNEIMYLIKDEFTKPQPLEGPLELGVWRRHIMAFPFHSKTHRFFKLIFEQ